MNNSKKVYYKMYKAGKNWIFAAITTTTIVCGSGYFVSAHADTNQASQVVVNTTNNGDGSSSTTSVGDAANNNAAVTTPAEKPVTDSQSSNDSNQLILAKRPTA